MGSDPRPWLLILAGVLVHTILCYSIIDIHFQSPVVQGIASVQPNVEAPAKRVVLIVADGLRPDKLMEVDSDGVPLAPFLKRMATTAGRFGVSHTRPPTESRPGHVAMTAGFYEDPSALFSGWKVNPVPFDSVFDHVKVAWGLGSPDVVPMWSKAPNYSYQSYSVEMEDWSTKTDLFELDNWVFDKSKFLTNGFDEPNIPQVEGDDEAAKSIETKERESAYNQSVKDAEAFTEGPSILFLHLLGLDSQSHAHGGPSAQQYLDNIQVVDSGVERVAALIEDGTKDSATTYILTSDHGMTDQASHGDASPQCTETPFVVWGAGIRPHDAPAYPSGGRERWPCTWTFGGPGLACRRTDWSLNSKARTDIEQAQLAPLISAVLGVPCPTNSIAAMPVKLLRGSAEYLAKTTCASAEALITQYNAKAALRNSDKRPVKHHAGLSPTANRTMNQANESLASGDYVHALEACEMLTHTAQEALTYIQRYDWQLLYGIVVAAYIAWILLLIITLLRPAAAADYEKRGDVLTPCTVAAGVVVLLTGVAMWQVSLTQPKTTYYTYFTLLGTLTTCVTYQFKILLWAVRALAAQPHPMNLFVCGCLVISTLLIMASGFHSRTIYTTLSSFAAIAAGFLAQHLPNIPARIRTYLTIATPGLFALLPTNTPPATCLILIACIFANDFVLTRSTRARSQVVSAQLVLLAITAVCIAVAHDTNTPTKPFIDLTHILRTTPSLTNIYTAVLKNLSIATGKLDAMLFSAFRVARDISTVSIAQIGGFSVLQVVTWACFLSAWFLPLASPVDTRTRTLSTLLGLFTAFAVLSRSWELLFLGALDCALLTVYELEGGWLNESDEGADDEVEDEKGEVIDLTGDDDRGVVVRQQDVVRAVAFLFSINLAFFGTGNMASVASYDPASVFRLVRRFDKFVMGALLMVKILIPLLSCAVVHAASLNRASTPYISAYLLVVAMSSVMALRFFFEVTGEGSWQVIGTSISHFGTMNAQVVLVLVLSILAGVYTHVMPVPPPSTTTYTQKKKKM